ncbi:non-ribosomal peptide synthetase [Aestuariimicrobium ganziense]|uniref:non-ribosomal peptide synthetase n=1 Tax=Aestuariimicrobium ganziense TaxID=2773677 RepID=UPI001940D26D|nr:non-ribosomal peptide synthetase [Aestuariimicrobium ganziense]
MSTPSPRPLTAIPAGIWLAEQSGNAGTSYLMPLAIRLRGPLNLPALEAALAAVVARHPVLAARVVEHQGIPVFEPAPEPVRLQHRAGLDDEQVRQECRRPIEVATGPMLRASLWQQDPERHLLLLVVHHLAFDGHSKNVLVADLAASLAGEVLSAAGEYPLAADPDEDELIAAQTHWQQAWREPQPLQLPHAAPPNQDDPTVVVALDWAAVVAAADRLGASRFEVLTAGFVALLGRLGTPEPTVALDLGTRHGHQQREVGVFVTELPLTLAVDETLTGAQWVARVRAGIRELNPHRRVPLARALPGRGQRPAPASVSYRRREATPAFGGLEAEVTWAMPVDAPRTGLRLQVVEGPDGHEALLSAQPEVLSQPDLAALADQFVVLMAGLCVASDQPLAQLPLLSEHDVRIQDDMGDGGPAPQTEHDTLPAAVAAQAARTPEAVAVEADGETISYADLQQRIALLADELTGAGVRPGDVVGVRIPRDAELITTLLAVQATGAAYLPLDPDWPTERQRILLQEAGARAVVVAGGATTVFEAADACVPDRTAYVMFTSGSTGRPKGVMVPHRAVLEFLAGMQEVLPGTDRPQRWLASTGPTFDISVLELFGPLVVGGTVVVLTASASVAALVDQVTHVQATPSGWRHWLDGGLRAPHVHALCGGEALPEELAERLRGQVTSLTNVYGPTETTIWSTWAPVDGPPVHLGRALPGERVRLVDSQSRRVPLGLPGELWIGGAGLASGYLASPETTRARFVQADGSRWYRTGDLVVMDEAGRLHCRGRLDDQVKIRGHRVEPGEVESELKALDGVAASMAAARNDAGGGRLVAWVVAEPGVTLDPRDLIDRLGAKVPAHLVPSLLGVVDALPLTANGKLDRRALPDPAPLPAVQPEVESTGTDAAVGTPDAPDEALGVVLEVWNEVFGVDGVTADSDLFDLGGHSLTITAILARIRERTGVDIPLDLAYDEPTPAAMAAAVGGEGSR